MVVLGPARATAREAGTFTIQTPTATVGSPSGAMPTTTTRAGKPKKVGGRSTMVVRLSFLMALAGIVTFGSANAGAGGLILMTILILLLALLRHQ